MTRSKPGLAGALGVVSATLLPVWAVASPVRVASLAFTGIASVPGGGCGRVAGRVMCGLRGAAGCFPAGPAWVIPLWVAVRVATMRNRSQNRSQNSAGRARGAGAGQDEVPLAWGGGGGQAGWASVRFGQVVSRLEGVGEAGRE